MADLALEPAYKIPCPACHKDNLYSLLTMLTELRVKCPSCFESIDLADHYRRSELEELAEKCGRSRNFIAAMDSHRSNSTR